MPSFQLCKLKVLLTMREGGRKRGEEEEREGGRGEKRKTGLEEREGKREEERGWMLTRTLHSEGGVLTVPYTAISSPSPAGVLSSMKLLHASNHQPPIGIINYKRPVLQDVWLGQPTLY